MNRNDARKYNMHLTMLGNAKLELVAAKARVQQLEAVIDYHQTRVNLLQSTTSEVSIEEEDSSEKGEVDGGPVCKPEATG